MPKKSEKPLRRAKSTKKYIGPEARVQKYLLDNIISVISSSPRSKLNAYQEEINLHRAEHVLMEDFRDVEIYDGVDKVGDDRELIGSFARIDVLAKYRGNTYCCEIKNAKNGQQQFWDSLKILAYTKYYNWENNTSYKPAAILPAESVTFEHQIMAGQLDLLIIVFKKEGKEYRFMELGDEPYWKQRTNW